MFCVKLYVTFGSFSGILLCVTAAGRSAVSLAMVFPVCSYAERDGTGPASKAASNRPTLQ